MTDPLSVKPEVLIEILVGKPGVVDAFRKFVTGQTYDQERFLEEVQEVSIQELHPDFISTSGVEV